MTVFWKTDHLDTRTEIHLLPVCDRHTHALFQKHQTLDNRLPGMLLRTAFYRCCEATRVHSMVLGHVNRTAWGTKLLAPHGSLGLPCGLYQFLSLTEGTALLFESEWVLYPDFSSPPTPTAHPTPYTLNP